MFVMRVASTRPMMPRRGKRLSLVISQINPPKTAMLVNTIIIMSLRSRLKPPSGYRARIRNRMAPPQPAARIERQVDRGHALGHRARIGNKIKKPASPARQIPGDWALPSTPGRMAMTKSAKKPRRNPRLRMLPAICHSETPAARRGRMASGKAAPIEKRKNGKTKSTQVMPGRGLNWCQGGGTWAWYIQAGREVFPSGISLDNNMARMASPRRASKASNLFLGAAALDWASGVVMRLPARAYQPVENYGHCS